MTKIYSIITIAFLLNITESIKAQTSTLPTDTASLPYSVADILSTIQDAVENPSETNVYVKMMYDMGDFPKLKVGEAISENEWKILRAWIIQNPTHVEKLLIARKKNHDKFFNPGTINH